MSLRSSSTRYLDQAEELRDNAGQWEAYESIGNCVVLAGPGSGKTKTLTLKLARILAEDVKAPRGAACITFSQECTRELVRRLAALGIEESSRFFIGTVHGFCLKHLLIPYARLANLGLPYPLKIASTGECGGIFRMISEHLLGPNNPTRQHDVDNYRRAHVDRTDPIWQAEPLLAQLAEAYEAELRRNGLVDFDDLVIYGQRLILENDWVLPLIQAKFPILVVDEYQDLGTGLHQIVQRLVFQGGVRLFAVGDADQSVYGFNGASSNLLLDLAAQPEVQRVQLSVNYRCADGIIQAAGRVLGEERGYRAANEARVGRINVVHCPDGLADQARYSVNSLLPQILAAKPGREVGDIAILYRTAEIGDLAAQAALSAGINFIRIDSAAPYRKCAVTSWIEDCASWCSGGWILAQPRLRDLIDRWCAFRQVRLSEADRHAQVGRLTEFLWDRRGNGDANAFLTALRIELLDEVLYSVSALNDQRNQVDSMHRALQIDGALAGLDMLRLGGRDRARDQLNLLTFHSAKGCEFDVVIVLGLDEGVFPWSNETGAALQESRRLFYVAVTRARDEVHLVYSGWSANRFGRRFNNGMSRFLRDLIAN